MERSAAVYRVILPVGGAFVLLGGLCGTAAYLRGGVSLERALLIGILTSVSGIVLSFALARVSTRVDQLEPQERSDWGELGLYFAATAGCTAVFLGLAVGIVRIAYLMGVPLSESGFCAKFFFTWHWLHAVLIGFPPVVSAIQAVRKWPQTAANEGVEVRHH